MRATLRLLVLAALTSLAATGASAHIKISPTKSTYGARETYTMLVPNERRVTIIKIVGDFPTGLNVYNFEFKPGWKIDFKRDDKGKIVGAAWTGAIAPDQFVEFGMLAINPKQDTPLVWKFTQYYADGKTEEFAGPPGSSSPAPIVALAQPPAH